MPNFLLTASRGLEKHVAHWARTRKNFNNVWYSDGCVGLSCELSELQYLFECKLCERAFLLISSTYNAHFSKRKISKFCKNLDVVNFKELFPRAKTFRLCCKPNVSNDKKVWAQEVGQVLGVTGCLSGADVEVHLRVDQSSRYFICVPLREQPLSRRDYIKVQGLRSTVAHFMASKAVDLGGNFSFVVDPFCGKCVILVELARICPNSLCLGMDVDCVQTKDANENMAHLSNCAILLSDFKMPAFKGKVDLIISDPPFGQRYAMTDGNNSSWSSILDLFAEWLVPKRGRLVLLLTDELLERTVNCEAFKITDVFPLKLGTKSLSVVCMVVGEMV